MEGPEEWDLEGCAVWVVITSKCVVVKYTKTSSPSISATKKVMWIVLFYQNTL